MCVCVGGGGQHCGDVSGQGPGEASHVNLSVSMQVISEYQSGHKAVYTDRGMTDKIAVCTNREADADAARGGGKQEEQLGLFAA